MCFCLFSIYFSMKKHYYLADILKLCTYNHLSAEDIFLWLQKKHPMIAQGSVYRNLDKLVQEKKLTQIKGVCNKVLYEHTISPHIHFVDQKTWMVIDIPFDASALLLPLPTWYVSNHIDLIIYWEKK